MPSPRQQASEAATSTGRSARSARQIETEPIAPRSREWRPEVFDHFEWRRFEALCEALYGQAGVRTESQQSHGPDGGVDIWLYLKNATKPMIVQCKHRSRKVTVDDMRAFLGVLKSHDLDRGIFASSATFTADAASFATAHGISAQDRAGLLRLIAGRTPTQQASLLDTVYEGEYWRPTCASCGVKMTVREPKGGGALFWGCVNYARLRCTSKIHVAASEK